MNAIATTIAKHPVLEHAEDFYRLRREGIGFVEQTGSRKWTDYNVHDPGITIHEALCYAITDLASRGGWRIEDLLTPQAASKAFDKQPFFTAREILTVNPTTPDDFRRLLIDLPHVRNAWMFCKTCPCDFSYYAWCEEGELALSWGKPADASIVAQPVSPRGLYEALLELEADAVLGDLNDRKVERSTTFHDAQGAHPRALELRFPDIALASPDAWSLFLANDDAFAGANGASIGIALTRLGASPTFDLFTKLPAGQRDGYVRDHWKKVLYARIEITLVPANESIAFDNVTLRLFGDRAAKGATTADELRRLIEDTGPSGFIRRYRDKARHSAAAIASARARLHAHRNLDEDYCTIQPVGTDEIGVCADIEVRPDADIEAVQARIWFAIEQYFKPPIRFSSAQQLLDAGTPAEEIFNGPPLENGFIAAKDLQAAAWISVVRVSDILNRLMDIDGVIAVNRLVLTKYDDEGSVVQGAADPTWSNGEPVFDRARESASWLLFMSPRHQPRLYLNASRFLFYKNGLPFTPRLDEALDTLNQLRGKDDAPKTAAAGNDLPLPAGGHRSADDFFPVQYSLPLVYGVGPAGLPSTVSTLRRAQARQLKAYLMVFEQLLGNAHAQLAHTADLFSLDPMVARTYFVKVFGNADIDGLDTITNGLDRNALEALTESVAAFETRRNGFLDHVLARFGEQFSEYALLLGSVSGAKTAPRRLIADKLAFLAALPRVSRDRGKAFDYAHTPCAPGNDPGIKQRINVLLGSPAGNERLIVVEHLLLRPKFPGDALYPACVDADCALCGDEDPYSFRLTFVMPGWAGSYADNLDLRRFAERTIQQETPSHLLGKTCWVGDDAVVANPCDEIVGRLADLLVAEGRTAEGGVPGAEAACACAVSIQAGFADVFTPWYADKSLDFLHGAALETLIADLFRTAPQPGDLACGVVFDTSLWTRVQAMMVAYFAELARTGSQFRRFEKAWCAWLDVNATFDWTREQLRERVELLLTARLSKAAVRPTQLCECATSVLARVGASFHAWMDDNLKAGRALQDFPPFVPDLADPLCPDLAFEPGTSEALRTLLAERYTAYAEVSYRLRIVVELLAMLRSTYPGATLHDCDDGSDHNPVRLDNTALGSHALRTSTS
jgi:hypothetical protein